MMNEKTEKCPVAVTLGFIGSKWRIFVLRDLMSGPKRFSQLEKSIEGISHKVLTDNLRGMEKDGLIVRREGSGTRPYADYMLSGLGETIRPILRQLECWGKWYMENGEDN